MVAATRRAAGGDAMHRHTFMRGALQVQETSAPGEAVVGRSTLETSSDLWRERG